MKHTRFKSWLFSGKVAATLAVVSTMLAISPATQATPAFARQTGAECMKCHTSSFPRLNWTGERFMRNGFALPKSAEALDIGFPGEDTKKDTGTLTKDDLLLIQDVGKIFSVRGKTAIFNQDEDESDSKSFGSPVFFAIFASAQLAPDVPLWAEAETNTDTGETEIHNYFIGWTNVLKSTSPENATLVNFRAGGFTPTEWTSVSDQKRSIDSVSSHPGAYRGKHGFTQVGRGLGTKTGVEYYGYTDSSMGVVDGFFWAAGAGNATGGNFDKSKSGDQIESWLVGRLDLNHGSSLSVLYMNYNNDDTKPASNSVASYTVSGNWRINKEAELRAQYSIDDSGSGPVDDISGYTLQGDWEFARAWTGILRYDTTDNGMSSNQDETQVTAALVWAPWQNVKLTASWVGELDRAAFSNGVAVANPDDETDSYSLEVQFAM